MSFSAEHHHIPSKLLLPSTHTRTLAVDTFYALPFTAFHQESISTFLRCKRPALISLFSFFLCSRMPGEKDEEIGCFLSLTTPTHVSLFPKSGHSIACKNLSPWYLTLHILYFPYLIQDTAPQLVQWVLAHSGVLQSFWGKCVTQELQTPFPMVSIY